VSERWLLEGAVKVRQSVTSEWELVGQPSIEGVMLREVKNVLTPDGALVEIFRRDWQLGDEVGQVFQKSLSPHRVSAWHAHEHTTDRLFVNVGRARIVLYDARTESGTRGLVNELILGEARPGLLVVPPKVWHGVQNVSPETTFLLNLVDRAYRYEDPDHWKLPPDSSEIPYRFEGN
jgi:dTDP-4-dehydrorhamnose 3,5-epimerase